MCGIIGYIGKESPIEILINGLKSLEYRGYDSAGIALKNKDEIEVIKSVGKIVNLEEKVKCRELIPSHLGIAHTRWATHGKPSEENAHPHTVGKVTLVHNGIIENAEELREKLKKEGVTFNSETDTEVVAALINKYYENNQVEAIDKALKEIKGSYALGVLFQGSDCLYAVRKDSPLIVGLGEDENFIASDIAAIIDYTNKYFLLEENEIAKISKDKVEITKDGEKVAKQLQTTNMEKDAKDKCGYDHYMLKEIMEEPVVLEKTFKPYLEDLDKLPDLTKYEEIHVVACGSAMYAGMIGKTLLEEYANTKVEIDVASEYRYKNVIYDRKTLVILISQSGETADTIAAMRKAKENNVETLAIVNVKTSTIARESDKQIFIEAGPEIAVATTKAYILQVGIMALLAYKTALTKGLVKENDKVLEEAEKLPRLIKEVLDRRDEYKKVAKEIYNKEDIFFIGRKIDYATSMEGSLKLKEVSYIHSEAYQAGELKHGTISLVEEGMPVFAIVTDDTIKDKTVSNIEEVKSRGAKTIIISNEKWQTEDLQVTVPKISPYFQPILIVPTLQLIAYETAKLRGCDIDKPKNLAKSVTVE
ncbi:MAG: glutamine--fructose-6-phosphate transaminase (isomerizing) [Candidatus Faecimonas sp.]|nr:glutamine--fructose-6-phosphate transaminase (isomerizing) [Mycoplasmatota bacterium]MDY2907982.1 glutamine--fructose-6-phosphate transaminase (isomerizing) [Candidatus Faecimonas sp.]